MFINISAHVQTYNRTRAITETPPGGDLRLARIAPAQTKQHATSALERMQAVHTRARADGSRMR